MRVPWYLMAKGKGGGGYKTASGPIVSVSDALAAPLRSFLVNIDPVQSGSGDPSPDNVRPISGWSECNMWRTGKNLFDVSKSSEFNQDVTLTFNADGSVTCKNDNSYAVVPTITVIISIPPGTYTVSSSSAVSSTIAFYASDDGVTYSWYANGLSQTVLSKTVSINKPYIQLRWRVGGNTTETLPLIQLELGSTATAYEPYQGNTYTIQLGQTVYGGTLDVTNGVLTVDRAMVNISDLSWSYASNYSYMQTQGLANEVARPESNTTPLDGLLCSAYKTATAQQAGSGNVNATIAGDTYGGLRIKDNAYTDVATWLATAGNEKIVYPLATPITIPLTPTEISTLQGQNNVWADTGDVTVEYLSAGGADPNLMKLAVAFMGRK